MSSTSPAPDVPKHSALATTVKAVIFCAAAFGVYSLVSSLKATKARIDQGMRPAELAWSHGTSDRELQRAIQMNDGEFVAQVLGRTPRQSIRENIVTRLAFDLSANALDAFLWKGWDPNGVNGDGAPIIEAAKNGQYEAVSVLLRHGAKANVRDDQGRSSLFVASLTLHSNPQIVKLLASKGVPLEDYGLIQRERRRPDRLDQVKIRPIAAASLTGNLDSVNELISLGAKSGAMADEQLPPVICAALGPNPTPITKALVRAGADPRTTGVGSVQVGEHWRTVRANALYFNAALDHFDTVTFLLGAGLDPRSKASDGSTALQVATGRSAAILQKALSR